MAPTNINFEVLNNDAQWADTIDWVELAFAGIWFLHDVICKHKPNCELIQRIKRAGDKFYSLKKSCKGNASLLAPSKMAEMGMELETLASLGHSLWHLKSYLASRALQDELDELSQVSEADSSENIQRLRSRGFLLLAASTIAKRGFEIEFVERRNHSTPDFLAIRDGNRFACEATIRYPKTGDLSDSTLFWKAINEVVSKKTHQFREAEYSNGVLIIDCTPIWDAMALSDLAIGGVVVTYIPRELGGPRSGSGQAIRYDKSLAEQSLRYLEQIISGTGIQSLILWKNRIETDGSTFKRYKQYRVLSSVNGAAFWSYFENAIVFPGPNVNIDWK